MGSLFYINVPIREFEVTLRQQAQGITVTKEIENVAKGRVTGTGLMPATDSDDSGKSGSNSGRNPDLVDTDSLDDDDDDGEDVFKRGSFAARNRKLTVAGNLTNMSEGQGMVDLYEAIVDGRKANIVVSKDSMAIYHVDDLPSETSNVTKQVKWKKLNQDESDEQALQTIIDNTFLEKHLEDSLLKFNIINAKWGYSIDGNFAEVNFTVEAVKSEEIIHYMLALGIGVKYQSTLSVCAAVVFYNEHSEESKGNDLNDLNMPDGTLDDETGHGKKSFAAKFKASIKSRLTVAQVIQTVQGNAILTFDFIVLINVAAMIAGLGLLENSSVNLVASMLISPLMGPIMAGCFGTVIHDMKLVHTGLVSELIGLGICILVGFIFGVCVEWAPFDGPWANIPRWPTDEMVSRSLIRGFAVGILIAIPSGFGVALSILGGNAGSLVGVAISASLLPPAVNAGLFWGMTAFIAIKEEVEGRPLSGCSGLSGPPGSAEFYSRNHTFVFCANVLEEFALMGIVSFGLTMINIVLILSIGVVVLKIKEVAPHTTRKTMHKFWKEDLKVMRAYNRVHGSFDKKALLTELIASENSEEIEQDLANDHIFNQVNRQNLFGPGARAVLNDTPEVEDGGKGDQEVREPEIDLIPQPRSRAQSIPGPSRFWGLFGRKPQASQDEEKPIVEVEEPEPPEAEVARVSSKTDPVPPTVKPRPHLIAATKHQKGSTGSRRTKNATH